MCTLTWTLVPLEHLLMAWAPILVLLIHLLLARALTSVLLTHLLARADLESGAGTGLTSCVTEASADFVAADTAGEIPVYCHADFTKLRLKEIDSKDSINHFA